MHYIQRALKELQDNRGNQSNKHMLVGLDGFVDTIIHLVGKRHGPSDDFTRIDSIEAFGNRILGATGKSANIEMFPKMEKLGGNGPIMANALCAAGFPLTYIGALGKHAVLPVFKEFAEKTNAITVSDPGLTNALEFNDGKIMMGITNTLEAVTYEAIIETMGQGAFFDTLSRSSLVALVNWTMIPNMTAIFQALTDQVLPSLPPKEGGRTFFFDLADPEKRFRVTQASMDDGKPLVIQGGDYREVALPANHVDDRRTRKAPDVDGIPEQRLVAGKLSAAATDEGPRHGGRDNSGGSF